MQRDPVWKDVCVTPCSAALPGGRVLFCFHFIYFWKQVSLCFLNWFLTLGLKQSTFLSQPPKATGTGRHTSQLCCFEQELLNHSWPVWKEKKNREIITLPSSGVFIGGKGMEKSQQLLSTKQFIPVPEVNASQAPTQITNYVFRELIILEQSVDVTLKIPRKLGQPKPSGRQLALSVGWNRRDFDEVTNHLGGYTSGLKESNERWRNAKRFRTGNPQGACRDQESTSHE